MRKKIYEIIDKGSEGGRAGQVYDAFMLVTIVVSLIPLLFRETNYLFLVIEQVTVIIFIIDYVLRLLTADLRLGKGGKSFLEYPFTPMAIVDLVSILPSLVVLNKGLKAVRAISFLSQFKVFRSLRIFRLLRLLRVFKTFRVFKLFRYSKNLEMVGNVLKKQKDVLLAVVVLAVGYILVVALIMFNIEPATFGTYFDAVYWATVSLTTIGYGDIAAVTSVGRFITMVSALVGVAIIALPSGIITAGFMDELNNRKQEKIYKFWGWENATAPAITDEYKGIKTPLDLYDALSNIWCADTCAPRMRAGWTKSNMTLGQCSITAFLAQDIFGGEVYGVLRSGGNYHCYNVIGDCRFDLTSEQFGDEVLSYEGNPIQDRGVHFSKEEKRLRYEYLKSELMKYCNK